MVRSQSHGKVQRKIVVYVEGGGDSNELRTRCRQGFASFCEKVVPPRRNPKIIACGGRRQAFDDFCNALKRPVEGEIYMLLIDSEKPVQPRDPAAAPETKVWEHLGSEHDDWTQPAGTFPEQAHLMVQCMEAWFLADRDVLASFYGHGFNMSALPARADIEGVVKADIERGLNEATRHTKTKGAYDKGAHSFDLLALVDPQKVRAASPFAEHFIASLNNFLALKA